MLLRLALLAAALNLLAGCPARMAVNAAGNVAGGTVKAAGDVVGGAARVLTLAEVSSVEAGEASR